MKEDLALVCGDFGCVWFGDERDDEGLDWLEGRPFTTAFVTGNHENYDALRGYPLEEWHGGTIRRIRPSVILLERGQIFDLGGKRFFTMGGASSHDIQDGILDPASPDFEPEYWFKRRTRQIFRVKGVSWWPEELPSEKEYAETVRNLERVNWRVDCILTHCVPTSIQQTCLNFYLPSLNFLNRRSVFIML